MTASSLVILAMTLAVGQMHGQPVDPAQGQPFDPAQGQPFDTAQGQQAPPPQAQAAAQADARKPITLTGCVVAATDREDTLQLVAAEPEPARPVGTAGVSPAWTVPSYLLLGGIVRFSEHANRMVEITGVLEPVEAAADPKVAGDTTSRTTQAAPPVARLQVQSAKVVASTCTPKKDQ